MPRIKVISAGGFSRRPVSVLAEMHSGKVLVLTKFDVDLVMIYSGKKKIENTSDSLIILPPSFTTFLMVQLA